MLIAEIGNCHLGDVKKFKEMIRIANESGADLIKGQAFKAEDIRHGSMPLHFYKMCQLAEEQLIELVDYARGIGNDLFFSVFSKGFEKLERHQKWKKISGGQFREGMYNFKDDDYFTVVSIPKDCMDKPLPVIRYASVLYVSEYLVKDPELRNITALTERIGQQVGYSDHCIGVDMAIAAFRDYGASVVEKHFSLDKEYIYHGQSFRDSVHSANPKQLEELATAIGSI